MFKIKNNELLYGYFIASFYFSLFIPYIKGFLDLYSNNTIKVGFLVIAQGFIYVLPVLFLFLINIKQKKLLLIPALYLYVIFAMPYTEFFDIQDFIYGWKNYLLIFLNLFILLHLKENYEDFQIKIEKHIKVIFFLSGFILFFEILSSWVFLNSFYIFLRKLAGIEPILFGKPNGISLNIHAQGFIFSLGFFYFFINKNYKIALVMFICLLFAIVKTWLLAFFVTFIVFTFKSIKLKFLSKIYNKFINKKTICDVIKNNFILTSSVLVKKTLLNKFEEDKKYIAVEDFDMWLHILANNENIYKYQNEKLILYRVLENSVSNRKNILNQELKANLVLANFILKHEKYLSCYLYRQFFHIIIKKIRTIFQ